MIDAISSGLEDDNYMERLRTVKLLATMADKGASAKTDNSKLRPVTAAQGTPNRGNRGKSVNLIKFEHFFDFSPKWSWGPLDRLKILF